MKPPPLRSSARPTSLLTLAQSLRTMARTSEGREAIVRLLYGKRAELEGAERSERVAVADALRHWASQGGSPQDAGPVWGRAGALLARHALDRAAAIECFERALKCDRRELAALDRLAELLLQDGKREQLEKLWREHLQALGADDTTSAAEHERAWRRLARLRAGALGDLNGAVEAYECALSKGETVDCLTELAEARVRRGAQGDRVAAADLYYRASVLRLSENATDFTYVHKALTLDPEHVRARELAKLAPPPHVGSEIALERGFFSRLIPSWKGSSRRTALALVFAMCGGVAYAAYEGPVWLPNAELLERPERTAQFRAPAPAASAPGQDVVEPEAPTSVAGWEPPGRVPVDSTTETHAEPARVEGLADAKAPETLMRREHSGRTEVTVLHGQTKVRGGRIHETRLREAMTRAAHTFERCYTKAPTLSSEKHRGNLALSWVVRPNGRVQEVDAPGSHRDRAAQNCAVRSLRATRFPRTKGGPAKVSSSFRIVPDR